MHKQRVYCDGSQVTEATTTIYALLEIVVSGWLDHLVDVKDTVVTLVGNGFVIGVAQGQIPSLQYFVLVARSAHGEEICTAHVAVQIASSP